MRAIQNYAQWRSIDCCGQSHKSRMKQKGKREREKRLIKTCIHNRCIHFSLVLRTSRWLLYTFHLFPLSPHQIKPSNRLLFLFLFLFTCKILFIHIKGKLWNYRSGDFISDGPLHLTHSSPQPIWMDVERLTEVFIFIRSNEISPNKWSAWSESMSSRLFPGAKCVKNRVCMFIYTLYIHNVWVDSSYRKRGT